MLSYLSFPVLTDSLCSTYTVTECHYAVVSSLSPVVFERYVPWKTGKFVLFLVNLIN